MAFDQSTRGRLQKLVNSCRGLLSDEFSIQIQQTYGLDPKTGEVTPMARLTHLDDRQRHTAEVLRQTLPDGQVKFPHPWPPQIPPGRTAGL